MVLVVGRSGHILNTPADVKGDGKQLVSKSDEFPPLGHGRAVELQPRTGHKVALTRAMVALR